MTLRTLHIYGSTAIQSEFCPACENYAFVIGGKMSCCGIPSPKLDPNRIKIEIDTSNKRRKLPGVYERRAILEQQQNCCFYCHDEFESYRRIDGRVRRVILNWDHVVPFSYNGNNNEFVAACRECNSAKRALHFTDAMEARKYLSIKIHERKTASFSG